MSRHIGVKRVGGLVMSFTEIIVSRAPGDGWPDRIRFAALRALRTLLQGVAGAFPASGVGTAVLSVSYWQTFAYSCLAAFITALVSFLQNMADFLPVDPPARLV